MLLFRLETTRKTAKTSKKRQNLTIEPQSENLSNKEKQTLIIFTMSNQINKTQN